jgi:hypothetical protein
MEALKTTLFHVIHGNGSQPLRYKVGMAAILKFGMPDLG